VELRFFLVFFSIVVYFVVPHLRFGVARLLVKFLHVQALLCVVSTSTKQPVINLNLGCLHPVACVRSGDVDFYIRLRNVTIVGQFYYLILTATCFGHTTIFK
jgi:hypothetical protein